MARNPSFAMAARLFLTLLCIISAAAAPAPRNLPLPPNQLLIDSQPKNLRIVGHAANLADASIVPVSGMWFENAWRIKVQRQPQPEFQIELASPIVAQLPRAGVVLVTLWARATGSADIDHHATLGVVVEQASDPYDKLISRRFDLDPDWRRFDVAAKVGDQFAHAGAQLAIRLGYFPQTLEIGGITLRQFAPSVPLSAVPQTPLTYRRREPDAPCAAPPNS